MKHAILIGAYKNIPQLIELIGLFNGDPDFVFFIHYNRKSKTNKVEIKTLENTPGVMLVSRKYSVNWGSINFLKSYLFLAEQALKNKDIGRFHLISGQDLPIKSSGSIKQYFNDHVDTEFISYWDMPAAHWKDNGGMDRLRMLMPYEYFDYRSYWGKKVLHQFWKIQRILKLNRPFNLNMKLYGGHSWWSLSSECLQFIINYTKNNPSLLTRLKFSFAADEIYFQTVLLNSPFKDKIENNHLRYFDWVTRNGNCPAILDETDFTKLINSNALFARKFEHPVSSKVIKMLKNQLHD